MATPTEKPEREAAQPRSADPIRLSGDYLDSLQRRAPDVYQYHVASRFMDLLGAPLDAQGRTFISVFNEAYAKGGTNLELKSLLATLGRWINELHEIGTKAPKQLDSATAAMQYVQSVTKRARGFIYVGAQQAIRHRYRNHKLESEREKDLITLALIGWDRATGSDSAFIDSGTRLILAQDDEGFDRFMQARIAKEMPRIAKAIALRETAKRLVQMGFTKPCGELLEMTRERALEVLKLLRRIAA